MKYCLAIVSFVFLNITGGFAQTFLSTDTPLPIPLVGTSGTTVSTFPVPGGLGTITDVNVNINASHTFSGDLEIRLTSPSATTVQLFDNTGGAADASPGTIFDDEAAIPIGVNPLGPGSFIPFEPLSAFDGESPTGNWDLQFDDIFGGDSGTLFDWSLVFELAPIGPGMVTPASVPVTLSVDMGAINSAQTTGIYVPNALASSLRVAPSTALRGINKRLFRARSQLGNSRNGGDTLAAADRSLGRTMRFARRQDMTLRQALGLEEVPAALTINDRAPYLSSVFSVETKAGGKTPAIIDQPKRWEVFAAGDFNDLDQDGIQGTNFGLNSRTTTGTLGAEYRINDQLNFGFGWTYLDNDTDLAQNLGRIDLEGNLASVYATHFRNGNYVDLLYSYGDFDNTVVRNTLTRGGNATGRPDSHVHTVNLNAGKNFAVGGLVTGPILGYNYSNGQIDAYRESGGGAAAMTYRDREYESSISQLGWQVSRTREVNHGFLTLQGTASWGHEFSPDADLLRGGLTTSPFTLTRGTASRAIGGFGVIAPGASVGTDWLSLGAGAQLTTYKGVGILIDYQTELFRNNISSHYVGGKISVPF